MPKSLRFMAWNVQRLSDVGARPERIQAVVDWHRPDLVLLSEVGQDSHLSGYEEVGWVNTLNKRGNESQLGLKALVRTGSGLVASAHTLKAVGQKRALLKISVTQGDHTYEIYSLHANASKSGGLSAIEHAAELLENSDNKVVVGDFNFDLGQQDNFDYLKQQGANFLQGTDRKGSMVATRHGSTSSSLLDFVMTSDNIDVTALTVANADRVRPKTADLRRSRRRVVLNKPRKTSDHRPLVYTLRIPKSKAARNAPRFRKLSKRR